ncbi:MAG: T9SS type A sorting domain-containing protein [Calditrichia bacterium]
MIKFTPFPTPSAFPPTSGGGATAGQTGFTDPRECTIRIYSYAGQRLIETIEHNTPVYSVAWFQASRNDQEIASGVYFYVVTTPEGKQTHGKFVVIK